MIYVDAATAALALLKEKTAGSYSIDTIINFLNYAGEKSDNLLVNLTTHDIRKELYDNKRLKVDCINKAIWVSAVSDDYGTIPKELCYLAKKFFN